jgi:hypothetical protein
LCGGLRFRPHGCRFRGDQFCPRQSSHPGRRGGQHRNGPYRALAQLSFQAFQKGDNATAAELAHILERTWDAAEEGGADRSLAKTNKDLFEQIDKAMDVFIKPVMHYSANAPDPAVGSTVGIPGNARNMSHGAKIAMLGIPSSEMAIDWHKVIFNGLSIKGIYGREMYETWYKMTVMLECGLDISAVITHRLSWRDYEKGFEAMRSGKYGKVILDWRDVHAAEFHLKFGSQGVPQT